MPFALDTTLDPQLAPLAWLVGTWAGAGVIGYPTMESRNFGQEIVVTHDGQPFLTWESRMWLLDADGRRQEQIATETGYWRVLTDGAIELMVLHPTGIFEMYVGERDPQRPVVQLVTDSVVRSRESTEYNAAQRMYGYVDGQLMYALDMAAHGHPMTSHTSAQLKRVAGIDNTGNTDSDAAGHRVELPEVGAAQSAPTLEG